LFKTSANLLGTTLHPFEKPTTSDETISNSSKNTTKN